MPAQRMDYKVGEEVDVYREPSAKDAPGWMGPARITDIAKANRNIITVKWLNHSMEVTLQNLRRHLHFFCYVRHWCSLRFEPIH